MNSVYYNSSRVEILKRLNYLNKKNYVDFFRHSEPFILSMCLAYFGLAEDIIIERDSRNPDIKTRFTKHVEDSYLRQLFPSDIELDIRKRESLGTSNEWFLSALRNGIFHKGPVVDYHNRIVDVYNDGELNNLECGIPFSWFENFINQDIVKNIDLDKFKYSIFITLFSEVEKTECIDTFEGIDDFIENELKGFDVSISIDESSSDKTKIKRDDFIEFCDEKKGIFWKLYYGENGVDEESYKYYQLCKDITESTLEEYKKTHNSSEYDKVFFYALFKTWFEGMFEKKYPNYNINVSEFSNKSYGRQLFNTVRERRNFFKYTRPVFQRMDIASRLSEVVNYDMVDYLSKIRYLYEMYMQCKDHVTDEYHTTDFMWRVLKTNRLSNSSTLESDYAETIRSEMIEKGISQTYDKQITRSIINCRDQCTDDIHLRCRELVAGYDGDINSDECFDYIKGELLSEFSDYYSDESKRYEDLGIYSDQVIEYMWSHNIYRLSNAKQVLIDNRDDVIIALLYTLGINTYVMNKETHFKDELTSDIDYNFMDGLDIKGYSKDEYQVLKDVSSKRSSYRKKLKGINTAINGLNIAISKITDSDVVSEKTSIRDGHLNNLATVNGEIAKCDAFISSKDVITYEGVSLASISNYQCATTIRNCFAHCGRIHINGRDKYGETAITLTDYDENGNLSGIVETNLTSLIDFFSHDTFKNVMNKGIVSEEVGSSSKK